MQTSRSPVTPPFPYTRNARSCLNLASHNSSNLLPGHEAKGWRLLLPLLSGAGRGGCGKAQPKHGVCPGPQSVPVGHRGRMSFPEPGLIHRPVASQQVRLSDAEPGRTYTGTYSLLWDVSPNGKQQGVVRICHKYLLAKTSISPTVVRSP